MTFVSPPSGKPLEKPSSSRSWYTHSYDRPILYYLTMACAYLFPRPLRFMIARLMAWLFRQLTPREYAIVQHNLARITPDANAATITRLTHSLYRHFAYYFADLLSLNRQPLLVQQRYVHQVHGFDRLQSVLDQGQGFIAATAHLGNWELAGRLLSPFGKTVHVLVAPEQNAIIQRLLRESDDSTSLRFLSNDNAGSLMKLLMALRRGDVVAIQMDRSTGHRSDMQADFFGAPALFPGGPLILAGAARVPVIPFFCLMRPDHQYDIYIDEPIAVTRGDEAEALQQIVGALERHVVMAPDQWFNFYDVWDHKSASI